MEIAGKRALLTGATGGIGRAIAVALAERGASVVLSSRKREELDALAAALPGGEHSVIVSDLAEPGAAERLAAEATAGAGIDLLVANAGLPGSGRLSDFSAAEVARAVRVNLEAPMTLAHDLLPAMVERHGGHLALRLVARRQGGIPPCLRLQRDQVRPPRVRPRRSARTSPATAPASASRSCFRASSAAPACSPSRARGCRPGVGTSTPEEVAAGVVKAIEQNKAEVAVAPVQQRLLVGFAHVFPGLAARAQRGSGTKVAEQLARGQADKR